MSRLLATMHSGCKRQIVGSIGWLSIGLAWVSSASVNADEPLLDRAASTIGVKECAACHSAPSPIYERTGVTQFVSMREARVWLDQDKHAVAYELVDPATNALTRQIIERMGWSIDGPEFTQQCLTCHAGVPATGDSSSGIDQVVFGVQCEACHGPGSLWTQREFHQQVSWRSWTPEQKAELGMADLHDPATLTRTCASCHVGDLKQGRFVTHAMYAAGHPPLPPFEPVSALSRLPAHWRRLEAKPEFEGRAGYVQANRREELPQYSLAEQVAIRDAEDQSSFDAALAQHALQIWIDAADQPEQWWGDFALYDCGACHHELQTPSQRQELRLGRTPGRPRPAGWPFSRTVLGDDPQVQQAYAEFDREFDRQPFGNPLQFQRGGRVAQRLLDALDASAARTGQAMGSPDIIAQELQKACELEFPPGDFAAAQVQGEQLVRRLERWASQPQVSLDAWASARDNIRKLQQLLAINRQLEQRQSVLDELSFALSAGERYDADAVNAVRQQIAALLQGQVQP